MDHLFRTPHRHASRVHAFDAVPRHASLTSTAIYTTAIGAEARELAVPSVLPGSHPRPARVAKPPSRLVQPPVALRVDREPISGRGRSYELSPNRAHGAGRVTRIKQSSKSPVRFSYGFRDGRCCSVADSRAFSHLASERNRISSPERELRGLRCPECAWPENSLSPQGAGGAHPFRVAWHCWRHGIPPGIGPRAGRARGRADRGLAPFSTKRRSAGESRGRRSNGSVLRRHARR